MAHVVYETVEAVDAVVQIKREEDGEVSWSEPTYCTIQPVDESKSDVTSHIEIKPHVDLAKLDDSMESDVCVKVDSRNKCELVNKCDKYLKLNISGVLYEFSVLFHINIVERYG